MEKEIVILVEHEADGQFDEEKDAVGAKDEQQQQKKKTARPLLDIHVPLFFFFFFCCSCWLIFVPRYETKFPDLLYLFAIGLIAR